MKSIRFIIFFLCLLFSSIYVHEQAARAADAVSSIALMPFKIKVSKEDMAYLQDGIRDMLTSRLAAKTGIRIIDNAQTDALLKNQMDNVSSSQLQNYGKSLGTDYLISGSLTSLGSALAIDASVIDVNNGPAQQVQTFYASAVDTSGVIPAIDKLAQDIVDLLFGKPQTATQANQGAPAPPPETVVELSTAHPERQFIESFPAPVPAASQP